MIRLAEFRYTAVVPDQISPASFAIVFILSALRDIPLVHTFIIMKQNSRNIDTVRTRHTVFAVVTWDGRILHHQVGGVEQETVFLFRQRLQRTVRAEVVLQVLHVSHAAQHGEYAGISVRGITETGDSRRPPRSGSMMMAGIPRFCNSPYRYSASVFRGLISLACFQSR